MSSSILKNSLDNWDRLATYACFTGYGAFSLFLMTASFNVGLQYFSIAFNLEIVLAGLILIVSVYRASYWMRVVGYTIYLIGMLTIAGFIIVDSGSPVWLLVLGFAFQGVNGFRSASRERRIAHELAVVARELSKGDRSGI